MQNNTHLPFYQARYRLYTKWYQVLLLLTGIALSAGIKGNAQYENVWVFGDSAGVDFNSNAPKAIKTSINTIEGCASICDETGQLLFYTDGSSVWDRHHNIMPNGDSLSGIKGIWGLPPYDKSNTYSTAQAAIIIPFPGNRKKYYVFSLLNIGSALYHSIVDMNLNNGLGDVISGHKGIQMIGSDHNTTHGLTERMTAVSGNNCDVWLLLFGYNALGYNTFMAYNIGLNGLDTNAVFSTMSVSDSSIIRTSGYLEGTMDIAPSREKLAVAQERKLVVYDFDPGSGIVSNPLILDSLVGGGSFNIPHAFNTSYYSVCFSPDNTKLYAVAYHSSSPQGAGLFQFDLSLNNDSAIIASKILISYPSFGYYNYGYLKRAPNSKIYTPEFNGRATLSRLDVINDPNVPGIACQFAPSSISFLSGTRVMLGLPNSGVLLNRKIYNINVDTAFCVDSMSLQPNNINGTDYKWEDGSTDTVRNVYQSGTYWVNYKVDCYDIVDTFKVVVGYVRQMSTTDTLHGKCRTDTLLMKARNQYGSNYIWNDSSKGKKRKTNIPGIYWVTYQIDTLCEHHVDSFIVNYPEEEYKVSFLADTLVCVNDIIQFKNTSDHHFNYFNWSFGNGDSSLLTDPQYNYNKFGNYNVRLIGKIDSICTDTAHKSITVDSQLSGRFRLQPERICTGETIFFYPDAGDSTIERLHWQFGDGTEMSSGIEHKLQHAYDSAGRLSVTLTTSFRACPDTSYTDTVTVYPLPYVDLGKDTSICLQGAPVTLTNLAENRPGTYHYLWNTGDTSKEIQVRHPGEYSLKVSTQPLGCYTKATVKVTKDCYIDIPNAFTPNGDGNNDYFLPRKLLSKGVTGFKMDIYNRWGEKIFSTNNPIGRGWDGRFNGVPQPQGVYVYTIDVRYKNNRTEHYQGNVTLIR